MPLLCSADTAPIGGQHIAKLTDRSYNLLFMGSFIFHLCFPWHSIIWNLFFFYNHRKEGDGNDFRFDRLGHIFSLTINWLMIYMNNSF